MGVDILVTGISDSKTYVFGFSECDCGAEIGRLRRIDCVRDQVSKRTLLTLGCERITSIIVNSRCHDGRRRLIAKIYSGHPGRTTV